MSATEMLNDSDIRDFLTDYILRYNDNTPSIAYLACVDFAKLLKSTTIEQVNQLYPEDDDVRNKSSLKEFRKRKNSHYCHVVENSDEFREFQKHLTHEYGRRLR